MGKMSEIPSEKIRLCLIILLGENISRGKFSSLSQNFVTFPRRDLPRQGNPYFTIPLHICLILLMNYFKLVTDI